MTEDAAILARVTHAWSEDDAARGYQTIARLQPRSVSYLSILYVPVALGLVLIVIAHMTGVGDGATFFPLLATGTIAYLAGWHALFFETKRLWRKASLEDFRDNPARGKPIEISLGGDAITVASPLVTAIYRYGAITKVKTVDDFVVIWRGTMPQLLAPVGAFHSPQAAQSFADQIRKRIERSPR